MTKVPAAKGGGGAKADDAGGANGAGVRRSRAGAAEAGAERGSKKQPRAPSGREGATDRDAKKADKRDAKKADKRDAKKAGKRDAKKADRRDAKKADRRDAKKAGKRPEEKLGRSFYDGELAHLQLELVKLQEWVRQEGLKVVVIFEGRDAAGKGGVITRITQRLNPRICRVVALGMPTEREKTQWYFQRYIPHLPAAGEMVVLDRSWYNRAGVEYVMGFCTEEEHREFLRSCPEFERMLVRSGILLIKYWFSVSSEEQEKRFQARLKDKTKRWKLSPMDLESRQRWVEYSRAKDIMFSYTDIKQAPWYVVEADSKKRARLNCIRHLLGMIPYEDLTPGPIELPPRPRGTVEDGVSSDAGYVRPPIEDQTFVPDWY